MFTRICCRKKEFQSRTVWIGQDCLQKFPPNVIKNTKYNIFTFLPLVLWNQFKYFLNAFFLTLALTQFYPPLQVGYLYTYWVPLGFVIGIGLFREAVEDLIRYTRDKELNSRRYAKLTQRGPLSTASKDLKVGDIVYIEKGCRVPADMILLRTTDNSGAIFLKTDQLDGETDWKLRKAVSFTQKLKTDEDLLGLELSIYAEKPQKDIHSFIGKYTSHGNPQQEEALDIENTMWANTVAASETSLGIIIYSGTECRANMNNSTPNWKFGLIDQEVNNLTKVLFVATMVLSFILVALKGFDGEWWVYWARFIILFSYLIPISLLVHLEVAKVYYAWCIQKDKEIPGSVVRSTTIPEELGRLSYLLSDKTGTLTQNEMLFKKLHLGTAAYSSETFDDIENHLRAYYSADLTSGSGSVLGDSVVATKSGKPRLRKTAVTRASEAVKALALCHNVTPVYEEDALTTATEALSNVNDAAEADQGASRAMAAAAAGANVNVTYQASSPDEVALVIWAEQMGLTLIERTLTSMKVKTPLGEIVGYTILQIFPFTSETKRMGIIVRDERTNEIVFYMKGADVVMSSIVQYNDWLDEEVDNMAREGLRTLVVAKKFLSNDTYLDFEQRYSNAKCAVVNRDAHVAGVIESLERDMELLCVTGVEDRLQDKVRITLEQLRNASIKVWMLTGDKLETATCIAKSSRLVSKTQAIHIFKNVTNRMEAHNEMNAFRRKQDTALVVKGDSLEVCLEYYEHEFMELVAACPAVVCCRCSPQQKAQVVQLIKQHTGKRTAAIGDGGNDVPMIQAANVGIGIVGKEGRQASLAADFSLTQFSHVAKLLLVHGRNSYKRSASIAQFIIHRGLIITTMQAIFSAMFYFASVQLFQGMLLVGYATFYTMLPIVALALDQDVPAQTALTYPELYKDLLKGRSLTYKTFFIWCLIGLYQGKFEQNTQDTVLQYNKILFEHI